MSRMDELEAQNALRGLIVAKLLKSGVRRIDFSSEELHDQFKPNWPDAKAFDDLFIDMLVWLRDEGFVRYEAICNGTNNETCILNAQATSRTIAMLDQELPGAQGVTPRKIIQETGSADSDVANRVKLGAFIGAVLGGFTSAMST